jgi:hypothetical protein
MNRNPFKYSLDGSQYKVIYASSMSVAKKILKIRHPKSKVVVKSFINKNYYTGFERWS